MDSTHRLIKINSGPVQTIHGLIRKIYGQFCIISQIKMYPPPMLFYLEFYYYYRDCKVKKWNVSKWWDRALIRYPNFCAFTGHIDHIKNHLIAKSLFYHSPILSECINIFCLCWYRLVL